MATAAQTIGAMAAPAVPTSAFALQYTEAMGDLTFNSKPLINKLTMVAGENIAHASEIVHVICNRIMEVDKGIKLPTMYLLDSIVKNIQGPYIPLISQRLPEVFRAAWYSEVGNQTALVHLFRTWSGVFPAEVLKAIDSNLKVLQQPAAPRQPASTTIQPAARPTYLPQSSANGAVDAKSVEGRPIRGKDFAIALEELTFNSKPLISKLTIVAGESAKFAAEIAAAICNRIIQVDKVSKLPLMYLLDSIAKNIKQPYIDRLSSRLVQVFRHMWYQEPDVRSSLSHLFRTWSGVFPADILQELDVELKVLNPAELPPLKPIGRGAPYQTGAAGRPGAGKPKNGSVNSYKWVRDPNAPVKQPPAKGGRQARLGAESRAPAQPEPDFDLPEFDPSEYQQFSSTPASTVPPPRQPAGAYHFVDGLAPSVDTQPMLQTTAQPPVSAIGPAGMKSAEELLASLLSSAALNFGSRAGSMPVSDGNFVAPMLASAVPRLPITPPLPATPPMQIPTLPTFSAPVQVPSAPPAPMQPPPTPLLPPDLLSSLAAKGLLSGMPIPAQPTVVQPAPPPTAPPGLANPPLPPMPPPLSTIAEALAAQRAVTPPVQQPAPISSPPKAPSLGTEFRAEELKQRHQSVIDDLYSSMTHQCRTCGLRFSAQEPYSKHLDWHFLRTKRQKTQKVSSRAWFVSTKEWLTGTATEGTDAAVSFFDTQEAEAPKEDATLSSVPADDTQDRCALCGESFEVFWNPDEEEWMFKGATYANSSRDGAAELSPEERGPIVHVKCRMDSNVTVKAEPAGQPEPAAEPKPEDLLQALAAAQLTGDLATLISLVRPVEPAVEPAETQDVKVKVEQAEPAPVETASIQDDGLNQWAQLEDDAATRRRKRVRY
eukprot:jgi/Chlat1/4227/Chrsp27S04311